MGYKQESICGEELKTGTYQCQNGTFHGEELNTEQYAWYRADTKLYMWCRAATKKTRSKMMKDEFFASYLKKKNNTLLSYHQDE